VSLAALPAELEEAREVYYNSRGALAEQALAGLRAWKGSDSNGEFQSLAALYEGLLLQDLERKDEASSVWAAGMESAGDPLLRARIQSRWMLLQKTAVLIKSGSEIQEVCEDVLEKNPREFYALVMSAQGLVNAPPLFGGDPEEAARLMEASRPLASNNYELFDLELVLADALRRRKRWDDAEAACRRALALFPGNKDAAALLDAVKARKRK